MRIVVCVTVHLAVTTLRWLLESEHTIPALVTRPTQAAKGREKSSLNPMQDLAIERGLEVYAPDSINHQPGE